MLNPSAICIAWLEDIYVLKDYYMNNPELRKRIRSVARLCLMLSVIFFAIAYVFFHHITPEGFILAKQIVAGKPYVTEMIGILATIMFATHIILELSLLTIFKREKNDK